MPAFGDYQNEIYFAGLRRVVPKLPVDYAALFERARAAKPPGVLAYAENGCGNEHTQRGNVAAFERWGVLPRMLVDCTRRDLSIELFGHRLPTPMFLSPIRVIGLVAPDGHGDIAAAKAAEQTGVPFMVSTLANDPMEEVARHLGDTPGYFQLYTPRDAGVAESLVRRAEACGFKALVVTLDTLADRLAPARPQHRQLSTAARPRADELLHRSRLPRLPGRAARGGRAGRGAALDLLMAVDGYPTLKDLGPAALMRV